MVFIKYVPEHIFIKQFIEKIIKTLMFDRLGGVFH